jgi:hypothetical protein
VSWTTHWRSLPPGNRVGIVLCLVLLAAILLDIGFRIRESAIRANEMETISNFDHTWMQVRNPYSPRATEPSSAVGCRPAETSQSSFDSNRGKP